MMFNPDKCVIPKIWCGKGTMPKGYLKTGTRSECIQVGFGAGMYSERVKHTPSNSLQKIKYVGEKYDARFKLKGIKTTVDLLNFATKRTKLQIKALLEYVFTRKSKGIDKRAYNSTMMYLYSHGIAAAKIPQCIKI